MTDEEFVLANTEYAIFERNHVRMKYKDQKYIFRIHDPKPIQYGRPGDFDPFKMQIFPIRKEFTEKEKQVIWKSAASHVREHHYICEHPEEFTIYPENDYSHQIAYPK
jgi:hypothetical protein